MRLPYWLLKMLPYFDYICPKCRKEVEKNSHECSHCGEKYPFPIRVPPYVLKELQKGNAKPAEEYVHKHVFPRVSEFERNYLTKYFTVLFSDGFETNNFNAWTGTSIGVGATLETVSSPVHHGAYAAHSQVTTTLGAQYAYCYKTLASTYDTIYARMYIRFPAIAFGVVVVLRVDSDIFGTRIWQVKLAKVAGNTYKLSIYNQPEATYYDSSAFTPVIDTWYCLEFQGYVNAATGWFKALWNDVAIVAQSGKNTGATNAQEIWCGITDSNQENIDLYFDCVVVADAPIRSEKPLFHVLRGRGGDKRLKTEFYNRRTRPPSYSRA